MPRSTRPSKVSPHNKLNDLTGKEWIQFTKTWFIHNPPPRSKTEEMHPAKFPEGMVTSFVEYFTKSGGLVLDPMCGTGSALVAAVESGRSARGVELNAKWAGIARTRVENDDWVVHGDARDVRSISKAQGWGEFDFMITSPPYWDMLHHSRGNVRSTAKRRVEDGLAEVYSGDGADLGNQTDYETFLDELVGIYRGCRGLLRKDAYAVIVCQNIRVKGGDVVPFAFDLTSKMREDGWSFQGERIWCQDNKRLGIWGYPSLFIPNYHHHYCLIFRA